MKIQLLDILRQSKKWSLDGSFKSAPKLWTQCFIIGCYINKRIVICAQALLPGKDKKYYVEALRAIKKAIQSDPETSK